MDKLFNRYFARYALDKAERERWKAAAAGNRKFHRDEIIGMCRSSGIPANEVAWLIRYEVRQLKQRWQNETLYEYRGQLLPRPGTVAARRTGLAILVLGGVWAIVALRAHLLADVFALASAYWAWRCWLRVKLERQRGRPPARAGEGCRRRPELVPGTRLGRSLVGRRRRRPWGRGLMKWRRQPYSGVSIQVNGA